MKNSLLFLLKAVLIALVLFASYQWLSPAYMKVLFMVSSLVFDNGERLSLYYTSLDKIIPFAALLLATPRMPWLRKVLMLAAGLAVFIAMDVSACLFTTSTDVQKTGVYNSPPSEAWLLIWEIYGRGLMPLLLWLLTSYRYLNGMFRIMAPIKAVPGVDS